MSDIISDAQVDQLLREVESRLRDGGAGAGSSAAVVSAPKDAAGLKTQQADKSITQINKEKAAANEKKKSLENLTVRAADAGVASLANKKDTAGKDWFDLPKTDMTPEFKRDWQLLRMRGLLDPKHQKKNMRATAPEYSQIGEVVAGPTEFYSARLTRKERKQTLLGEVMAEQSSSKLGYKYAGIQKDKTSGKKAHYQRVVQQRRKRQN